MERRDTRATIALFLKTMVVGVELVEVMVVFMVIKEVALVAMEEVVLGVVVVL
jgi:hypothetical protein